MTFADPSDLRLLRSTSVSKPLRGVLIAGHPFSTPISCALTISTASTPLEVVATLRIEAFDRFPRQKLASPDAG